MNPHHALLLLGTFLISGLMLLSGWLLTFYFRVRASEGRERALPKGPQRLSSRVPRPGAKLPIACEFLDGSVSLKRAEAASREVMA